MSMKISQFAFERKKKTDTVMKYIQRHSEDFKGHVTNGNIDEIAFSILDKVYPAFTEIIVDDSSKVRELQENLKKSYEKIMELQQQQIESQKQISELKESKVLLEVAKAAENEIKAENKELKEEKENLQRELDSFQKGLFGFYRKK